MPLSGGGSPTGVQPAPVAPELMPPLNEEGAPTSAVVLRPIFARGGSFRSPRLQPAPPVGPPPRCPQSDMAEALDMKLPGISEPVVDAEPRSGASGPMGSIASSHEKGETFFIVDSNHDKDSIARIGNMSRGRHAAQIPPPLSVLPESPNVSAASFALDKGQNRAEPRLGSAEVSLAARKAQRVAKVRNIAQEVVRVTEDDANGSADENEREEIERALAVVDETRRKRMERQQQDNVLLQHDDEKLRKRKAKREQLMKKRRDMEERLEEEATKMAELTESAKKKGQSKFMSEEAKRDAEELLRNEAEAVAQLEQQAADMILKRQQMQKKLAAREHEKAAEIKAHSSALATKRALVETRMRQEADEIRSLSEAAKREVEAKMIAEAAAIAEMEKQAMKMSIKRAELQVELSNKLEIEDTLVQEAKLIARKREKLEAKMKQEEKELKKLSDDAKHRVLERMATEAAAIADMEREANKLAEERAALASEIAEQRSCEVVKDASAPPACAQGVPHHFHAGLTETQSTSLDTTPDRYVLNLALAPTGDGDVEEVGAGIIQADSNSASAGVYKDKEDPEFEDRLAAAFSLASPEALRQQETSETFATEDNQWNQQQTISANVCAQCTDERAISSAHLAAAAGHVICLEAIQCTHRELLVQADSSGRTPLFYACANAHVDAADLIIREDPHSCHAVDMNRDTPLHAAALAGSRLCCRLLLQYGRSEVEPLNAMHMTPAHLAASNDVLEVLSQHGADLNAKDADLRTPLFVACASDRLEKAEFLCELLEYADQDLGESDKRGDTPMHAAAYNGSTACLLLLLQYGVQPDARNAKGLRPIDLASRRGQTACEKILMEYQLHHHVNNSCFDSVLFLATLEGHKRCKESLDTAKQKGDTDSEAHTDSSLVRPQSLMSLSRERSVRLEHWGDWIAYEDQNEKSVFWYNHVEDKSQKEAPSGVRRGNESSLSKMSMRLKRHGEWIEYTLPDGNVFYYNDQSNEFQWERPDDLSSRPLSPKLADEEDCPTSNPGIDASIGDWTAFKDPSTGLVFWYNHVTDESQWETPGDDTEAERGGKVTESRTDDHMDEPEERVREVSSVDDLFTPR